MWGVIEVVEIGRTHFPLLPSLLTIFLMKGKGGRCSEEKNEDIWKGKEVKRREIGVGSD